MKKKNHRLQHQIKIWWQKSKRVCSHYLDCSKAQTHSRVSNRKGLSTHRKMPLLKQKRRDLNKLKRLPGGRGSRRADEMENSGSLQCVHWEEWMNKLKAMAFQAMLMAKTHYWFLRRKCILNVSRDPAFLPLPRPFTDVSTPCSHQKWLRSVVWYTPKAQGIRIAVLLLESQAVISLDSIVHVCLTHFFPFDTMQQISTIERVRSEIEATYK